MSNQDTDGGYYAIKGFLYQFDKTLIEILENPDVGVRFEHRQDIDYQDYVIQVKHRETQSYADSKIRGPITQLLNLFIEDPGLRFCLYCYFKDRTPAKWALTAQDLDRILGTEHAVTTSAVKEAFVRNFYVQFSDDYESQFLSLLGLIETVFSLGNTDQAILYHSLFRSRLLEMSLEARDARELSMEDLRQFTQCAEKTIFYTAYSHYLDGRAYERLIKREYFTFSHANLDDFERLFIIDCDDSANCVDLEKIICQISRRYFRVGKSPQPFLCLRNLTREKLVSVKRDLADQNFVFNDGTCFDGDRFRLDRLVHDSSADKSVKAKIIDEDRIVELLSAHRIHEIFQFYLQEPLELAARDKHIVIQVAETCQILRML